MKTGCLLILLLIVIFHSFVYAVEINGYLETIEDKLILKVQGTITERGFAQGYLIGDRIHSVINGYILGSALNNNPVTYNYLRNLFENNFEIDARFITESQAIIQGINAAEHQINMPTLGRDMDYIDILFANAIVDFIPLYTNLGDYVGACSSLSSWGESTENIEGVNGEQMITRHLDWMQSPVLRQNQLIIVHFPAEENQQNWLSLGFAGLIGSLSGINESGLGAFMNVGCNHNHNTNDTFHPVLMSIRNAVEFIDYNNDGLNNYLDIVDALENHSQLSGSIIHIVNKSDQQTYPIILEVNHENGISIRNFEFNNISPEISGNNLAATNHFRTLYPTQLNCYRYNNIADSLQVSNTVTHLRSWDLLRGAAGVSTNFQAIQYTPVTGDLKWAVTLYPGNPAHSQTPTVFNLDELFTYDTESTTENNFNSVFNNRLLSNYPNPFNPNTVIYYELEENSFTSLSIYNTKGQKVNQLFSGFKEKGSHSLFWDGRSQNGEILNSGVYFIKLNTKSGILTHKLLLLK